MSCAHHPNHIFCPYTFWLREKNVNTFSALGRNIRPFLWLTFYEYVRIATPITTREMPRSILWSPIREQSHPEKANKRNGWNNLYKPINIYFLKEAKKTECEPRYLSSESALLWTLQWCFFKKEFDYLSCVWTGKETKPGIYHRFSKEGLECEKSQPVLPEFSVYKFCKLLVKNHVSKWKKKILYVTNLWVTSTCLKPHVLNPRALLHFTRDVITSYLRSTTVETLKASLFYCLTCLIWGFPHFFKRLTFFK